METRIVLFEKTQICFNQSFDYYTCQNMFQKSTIEPNYPYCVERTYNFDGGVYNDITVYCSLKKQSVKELGEITPFDGHKNFLLFYKRISKDEVYWFF